MINDADGWKAERLRRYGLTLSYHRAVSELEGLDERTWLERHVAATVGSDSATSYALIHPTVAPVPTMRWEEHRGRRAFASARRPAGGKCQSLLVWGYECPLRSPVAELEMDHAWPFSLGGQSVPSNGVLLCRLHNRAKSHDVHNYDWPEMWPSWLLLMLSAVRSDCERRLRLAVSTRSEATDR